MADETPAVVVAETGATAPVVETPVAPAPILTEAPAVENGAAAAAETETPADAPVEVKAEGDAPVEGAGEVKPEPVVYGEFKLPDNLKAAPEQLAEFTKVLGEHGLSQEAGQKLMDLHGAALKATAEQIAQHQQTVFNETQAAWREEFDQRAGNRRDTIANDAKWALAQVVPDQAQRAKVIAALNVTGAGNNPDIVFAFAAMAKKMRERPAPAAGAPAKANGGLSKAEQRYNRPAT